MPGNEQYPGAKRRPGSKKDPMKGSGGQRRRGLEGKGPTPRAENHVSHPRARAKARAESRAAQPTRAKQLEKIKRRFDVPEDHKILCGRNAVTEAAYASVPIARVFMAISARSDDRLGAVVHRAALLGAPVLETTKLDLDALTDSVTHQGVAIEVPAYEYTTARDLLERAHVLDHTPLLMALGQVTDPHNPGVVLRSAGAFGANGVIIPERRSVGVNATVWKVSVGTAARVRVARETNLVRTLEQLKKEGCFVVGLDGSGNTAVEDLTLADSSLVLVTGTEGTGLSRLVCETCDVLASIPTSRSVEFLSTAVTTGVSLYEVDRLRRRADGASSRSPPLRAGPTPTEPADPTDPTDPAVPAGKAPGLHFSKTAPLLTQWAASDPQEIPMAQDASQRWNRTDGVLIAPGTTPEAAADASAECGMVVHLEWSPAATHLLSLTLMTNVESQVTATPPSRGGIVPGPSVSELVESLARQSTADVAVGPVTFNALPDDVEPPSISHHGSASARTAMISPMSVYMVPLQATLLERPLTVVSTPSPDRHIVMYSGEGTELGTFGWNDESLPALVLTSDSEGMSIRAIPIGDPEDDAVFSWGITLCCVWGGVKEPGPALRSLVDELLVDPTDASGIVTAVSDADLEAAAAAIVKPGTDGFAAMLEAPGLPDWVLEILTGRLAPVEVPDVVVHEPRGLSNAVDRSVGLLLADPSTPGSAFWQGYVRTATDKP